MDYKKKGNKYTKCGLGDFLVNHLLEIVYVLIIGLFIAIILLGI